MYYDQAVAGAKTIGQQQDHHHLDHKTIPHTILSCHHYPNDIIRNESANNNCDQLAFSDKTMDFRLSSIANNLTYLVQHPYKKTIKLQSFRSDRSNIKNIFNIYSKLLNISPIETHLPVILSQKWPPNRANNPQCDRRLLVARQQVLNYIENLNGYCDSINLLRCILKSAAMIGVMVAFDGILEEIDRFYANLTRPQQCNDSRFKIAKEWSV